MDWFEIVIQTLQGRYAFFAFVVVMMLLDIVSGLTKAFATNTFSSTKVKQGLFHKAGITICVLLAIAIDVFTAFIPDLPFEAPVCAGVCILVGLMEIMSILENIAAFWPEFKDSKLMQLLLPHDGV